MQYGEVCYTAVGDNAWSHDEVYRQHPLLEKAVGTTDDPKAEIMDVTQGSGKNVSGEATNYRKAHYLANKALFAKQLIEDLRIQKAAVRF